MCTSYGTYLDVIDMFTHMIVVFFFALCVFLIAQFFGDERMQLSQKHLLCSPSIWSRYMMLPPGKHIYFRWVMWFFQLPPPGQPVIFVSPGTRDG